MVLRNIDDLIEILHRLDSRIDADQLLGHEVLQSLEAADGTTELHPIPGVGDGQIPRLLEEAFRSGYDGFCVLEPHLVVAERSFGFTGPERFADAASALKRILDDRSIAYA